MDLKSTVVIATILAVFIIYSPRLAATEPQDVKPEIKSSPGGVPPDDGPDWEAPTQDDPNLNKEPEEEEKPVEPPKPKTPYVKGSCANKSYPSRITVIVEYSSGNTDETVMGTVVINLPPPED